MNDPATKPVLVLGGGVAGLTAALALAGNGLPVVLAERQPSLGGHVAGWSCMATERCLKCSSCLVADLKRDVLGDSRIRTVTRATLGESSRRNGGFQVRLLPVPPPPGPHAEKPEAPDSGASAQPAAAMPPEPLPEKPEAPEGETLLAPEELAVDSIFLATGFEPFPAGKKPMLGYGKLEQVVTTVDLNRVLLEDRVASLPVAAAADPRVAFLLCVGSRDREAGREYCSQVCCKTSLRLAARLLHERPDWQISLFYIDLQVMGKGFREFVREYSGRIRFLQGVPGEVLPAADDQVSLTFESPAGAVRTETFGLVVLAVGMTPGEDTARLAGSLELAVGSKGFLEATDAAGRVFAIGACRGPMDIPAARREALAAVGRYLQAGRNI